MVNIYASSVAKTVFVWICIVLMAIGFVWSVLSNKTRNPMSTLQNIPGVGTALNGIMGTVSASTSGVNVGMFFVKHGGSLLFWISWGLLVIFELFWRPYRHLSDVDSDKINNLVKSSK